MPRSSLFAHCSPARRIIFAPWILALLALCFFSFPAHSETTVSATLSQSTMTAGGAVELILTIQGGERISIPKQLEVKDLQIEYRGQSRQTRVENFKVTSSLALSYEVTGEKPGVYTIPAIELSADGRTVRSQPLQLTIEAPSAGSNPKPADEVGFAEITLLKETAYLGESVQVELRLYVDARVRWNIEQMPSFEGEGFTKQKMPNPRREQTRRDGKEYDTILFRNVITPSKAGKISIGPSSFEIQAQVPQTKRGRSKSPFDDFFGDSFFDPFSNAAQIKKIAIKAPAIELEVKPLPSAGRPKDFSGAVGTFTFSAEGGPNRVKLGDPITMKLKVGGRGNFDRMNPPALANPEGWHAYPPTSEFTSADDLNQSGTKSFELAIIPETKKDRLPQFNFSYFDPTTEKYQTIQSQPGPLEVEGSSPPAKPPIAVQPQTVDQPPNSEPPPPKDIVGLESEFGVPASPVTPLYSSRTFQLAQLLPAAGLLGWLATQLYRPNRQRAQRLALKRQLSSLRQRLTQASKPNEFFELAVHFLQTHFTLTSDSLEKSVDLDFIRRSSPTADLPVLNELFERHAELRYSGAAQKTLSESDRQNYLTLIDRLAHVRH